MCGIVGYSNDETTQADLLVLQQVLIESRIRGKHASGLVWFDGKGFQHRIEPVPIDQLVSQLDLSQVLYRKNRIALIAHARYSTSDLRYNQPLLGENLAIAHNGVITQRHPKYWQDDYGYTCEGKNDSELLLRALERKDDPLKKFPDASIAYVALTKLGVVIGRRNGRRPLWQGKIGKGRIIASTFDILRRAGVESIQPIPAAEGRDIQWRKTI